MADPSMDDSATTPDPDGAPPLDVDASPSGPAVIDTENTQLNDGLNRCPKCGSSDIQLRVSTGMLICLFCRHSWAEETIEPLVSDTAAAPTSQGTIIGSGAADIDAAAAGVVT